MSIYPSGQCPAIQGMRPSTIALDQLTQRDAKGLGLMAGDYALTVDEFSWPWCEEYCTEFTHDSRASNARHIRGRRRQDDGNSA
jgi:hypothetical protein